MVKAGSSGEVKSYRNAFSVPVFPEGRPFWMLEKRKRAYARFKDLGFPAPKDEAWRRDPLPAILDVVHLPPAGDLSLDPETIYRKALIHSGSKVFCFVNGIYDEGLTNPVTNSSALSVCNLGPMLKANEPGILKVFGACLEEEANPFACINTFSFEDGAFVKISKEHPSQEPIHLCFIAKGDGAIAPAIYPRIFIWLEDGASADFVIQHLGYDDQPYFVNAVAEIFLQKGASASVQILERGSPGTHQLCKMNFYLEEKSNLDLTIYSEGGKYSRNDSEVFFRGKDAACTLRGLSFLSGDARVSNHLTVHHNVPRCTSRQYYKNILCERAEAEFDSLVRVCRGAVESDSNQLNRNLLLSSGARAYARPQLQIEDENVKASHGATTGQLEERELFYFQSRGISLADARYILTYGIAEEILQEMKPFEIRRELEDHVRHELKQWFDANKQS
ncbi:MAG: Fe-S cluster assembly protein SufD [Candidatus Omnitrophica bacterium]|nr:Fe-S cluster assembly protein SufD [Candidatus Omnitrophota bacterium]